MWHNFNIYTYILLHSLFSEDDTKKQEEKIMKNGSSLGRHHLEQSTGEAKRKRNAKE